MMDGKTYKFSSAGMAFDGSSNFSKNNMTAAPENGTSSNGTGQNADPLNGSAQNGMPNAFGQNVDPQQLESVQYSAEVKNEQIDMNPTAETEPLTGSSVIVEPGVDHKGGLKLDENGALPNGFKPGYGPNSNMPRIEKPVKPKMSERLKRSFGKHDKKKIRNAVIAGASVVAVGVGIIIWAVVSGVFRIDYSGTYFAAKDVRTEMQKLKSDASCQHVSEYIDNEYTKMTAYEEYVTGCQKIGSGVTVDIIKQLGQTEGVLKDPEIAKRYDSFYSALETADEGSTELSATLELYSTWHEWIVAEASGDDKYVTDEWEKSDIESATKILQDSGNKEFIEYANEWAKKRTELSEIAFKYYHPTINNETAVSYTELKTMYDTAKAEFDAWKKEKQPDMIKEYPIETVDIAKLYADFEELYEYVRKTYQDNYNSAAGGCREMVNGVVCD